MPRNRRIGLQHGRGMAARRQAQTQAPGVQHEHGGGRSQGPAHGQGLGLGLYLLATGSVPGGEPSAPRVPVGSVADLGATTGTGVTAQKNVTLSSGDSILVVYATGDTPTTTVSDSGGNDYATTSGTGTTPNGRTAGWAFASIVAPSTFVKVALSSSQSYVMRVFRLSRLPSSGALDQSASASGASASPNSGPTGALAQASEIAFEFVVCDQNGGSWTADFTHDLGYIDPSTLLGIGAGWKQTTSTAAVTAAPTLHPGIGGANWYCQLLTFKLV